MTTAEEYFHLVGKQIKGANSGKIFGHVCYAIGKKPFYFLEEQDAVFKLYDKLKAEAIKLKGATLFNPYGEEGKGMGNWIQLPYSQKAHWEYFAKEAYLIVKTEIKNSETKKAKPKKQKPK